MHTARGRGPKWPAAVVIAALAALPGGCDSTTPDCPSGQQYQGGGISSQGGCAPARTECRSWSYWIAPGSAGASEPPLAFDRSTSPARADLKVGARMQGGLVAGRFDSTACAADIRFDGFSFRSSDPAILRLVETPPPYGAKYLAVAPGTARVFAIDPAQPEARREAELSICVDPTTFDDKNCVRMPLVIRVVP